MLYYKNLIETNSVHNPNPSLNRIWSYFLADFQNKTRINVFINLRRIRLLKFNTKETINNLRKWNTSKDMSIEDANVK